MKRLLIACGALMALASCEGDPAFAKDLPPHAETSLVERIVSANTFFGIAQQEGQNHVLTKQDVDALQSLADVASEQVTFAQAALKAHDGAAFSSAMDAIDVDLDAVYQIINQAAQRTPPASGLKA